jgi:hypothetical protein
MFLLLKTNECISGIFYEAISIFIMSGEL